MKAKLRDVFALLGVAAAWPLAARAAAGEADHRIFLQAVWHWFQPRYATAA
jgi:hypothetical protein